VFENGEKGGDVSGGRGIGGGLLAGEGGDAACSVRFHRSLADFRAVSRLFCESFFGGVGRIAVGEIGRADIELAWVGSFAESTRILFVEGRGRRGALEPGF
jgi:hypothetical protein